MVVSEPKLKRAVELIREIGVLLETAAPWGYALETDFSVGEGRKRADRNDGAADDVALRIGDCVQNLRASLDHAWTRKVLDHVPEKKQRAVQFPFCEVQADLSKSIAARMPGYENDKLTAAIEGLKPFRGGNVALWTVHELGIPDRHMCLLPLGDFKRVSSAALMRLIPDFPTGLIDCGFGQSQYDVVWNGPKLNRKQRRARGSLPSVEVQRLDIPVDAVFGSGSLMGLPIVAALEMMAEATSVAVEVVNDA